jgi:hypothetical protein
MRFAVAPIVADNVVLVFVAAAVEGLMLALVSEGY